MAAGFVFRQASLIWSNAPVPETCSPAPILQEIPMAENSQPSPEKRSIGFGLFILIAGLVLLGERLGWLPHNIDWLFPAILIAWGVSELYQRLK
jgi:hypothetical protein